MKELTITAAEWKKYKDKLRRISEKAADQMQAYAEAHHFQMDQAMIDYAYALSTKYGEASAALACDMYDELAAYWHADVPSAVPANTATYGEVAKAMYGSMKQSPDGKLISSVADRLVKQAGADTTIKNAIRDGAYWAWIPTGDTCAFCITLASRGWQKASKKVLKGDHAEHIHSHCDCTFAVAFNEAQQHAYDYVYDPDKYLEMYNNADGSTSDAKIREIRRQIYPDIAEARNRRRRKLYQEKNQRSLPSQLPFVFAGEQLYIPEGAEIEHPVTIAGNGAKTEIRHINDLIAMFGGTKEEWKKRAGKVVSNRFVIDVHWYEKQDGIIHLEKVKEVIPK